MDRKESFMRKIKELKGPQCVVLSSPSNVRWLTGLDSGIVLISDEAKLVVPKLEVERTRMKLPWIEVVEGPRGALWRVVKEECNGPYLFDLKYLDFVQAIEIIRELGAGDISNKVAAMRRRKDKYEIEVMKRALGIAEKAFRAMWDELREGTSELEGAGILELNMRRMGAEDFAFPTIAAFGENSAFPHHVPTEKRLRHDELALFDFGAVKDGLRSDITRTHAPDKDPYREWFEAVREAVSEAMRTVKDGVKAKDVDEKAREVLKEYGLDKYFIHGLGHGVGADIHEPPYLSPSSNHELVEGDVVTIEPGVYVKGKGGVRIEQMVVVRKGGAEVLNELPIEW